jgi:hypothetical protein
MVCILVILIVKEQYLSYIKNNNVDKNIVKNQFMMMIADNPESEKIAELFNDITLVYRDMDNNELWLSFNDFLTLLKKANIDNKGIFTNYITTVFDKEKMTTDKFEYYLKQILSIKDLSLTDHSALFSKFSSYYKNFNQLMNTKTIQIQVNMAVNHNPFIKHVLNNYYGTRIF